LNRSEAAPSASPFCAKSLKQNLSRSRSALKIAASSGECGLNAGETGSPDRLYIGVVKTDRLFAKTGTETPGASQACDRLEIMWRICGELEIIH
jgi:hypothetical protein